MKQASTASGCVTWLPESDTQVVPPSATIPCVAFSLDGNYIYFRRAENAIASYCLSRPGIGRHPRVVVRDVDSAFTFSPDGRWMAYIRGNNPETGKYLTLTFADKTVWEVTWLPGRDGLFVTYQQEGPLPTAGRLVRISG